MSAREKCWCERGGGEAAESDSSTSESSGSSRKGKLGLFGLGKGKRLHFPTRKAKKGKEECAGVASGRRLHKWSLKFHSSRKVTEPEPQTQPCCNCACFKQAQDHEPKEENDQVQDEAAVMDVNANKDNLDVTDSQQAYENDSNGLYGISQLNNSLPAVVSNSPSADVSVMGSGSGGHEDCDEVARAARLREMERGVAAPASFRGPPTRRFQLVYPEAEAPRRLQLVCPSDLNVEALRAIFQHNVTVMACPLAAVAGCHTQVDFVHCLVPDLLQITNCSFYWGKMDRYEAERLLDGKPEGTFLLRDSAQEEFLFSVSFRKYGRSLHARIEQWNHKFSFDSHDPGVFTSETVCGLIEHYKDPSSCMFFEPMLTAPLPRRSAFPLQHLARAAVVSRLAYDDVAHLHLPKPLKAYLREYHYRQKVRVERFDDDLQWLEVRGAPP